MSQPETPQEGIEVRTYFVRGRNALVARAEFSELYVDYYLHQGQHGYQHQPQHDGMLKEALAALTLHCAARPWNEHWAWTLHFQKPLLNLFVAGSNSTGTVVGQIFTENVKSDGRNLFIADMTPTRGERRRSTVELHTAEVFAAVEHYYAQSEQRPARLFRHGEEDFVFVSAQPQCDMAWFESLTDETIRALDLTETLSLLETRRYRWECGCNLERMFSVLAPVMVREPEGLFGDDPEIRMSCPRCGARYEVQRRALESWLSAQS